jgi:Family of unknown function (DUF5317)
VQSGASPHTSCTVTHGDGVFKSAGAVGPNRKGRMRKLLIPIETENTDELVAFPESAVRLAVSRPRSSAFCPMFRFVKETYVWLVWIPLLLLGLGIGMNLLAVKLNHGIMPVVLPPWGTIADNDRIHVAATANSRFLFLCDWIQRHATRDVASPGDFLITAGDFLKWPLVWMWVGFCCSQCTWRKLIGSYANA